MDIEKFRAEKHKIEMLLEYENDIDKRTYLKGQLHALHITFYGGAWITITDGSSNDSVFKQGYNEGLSKYS